MRALDGAVREEELFARATRHFGLLRFNDLVASGLTRNEISGRLGNHRLTRVHHRVYAFGHAILRDEGQWLAAQWACGPTAVVSHLTAAAFHGMRTPLADEPVHISVTGRTESRKGIDVHRMRSLERVDIHHAYPLSVTTIPRTLVDLADVLTWPDYRAAADTIRRLRLEKVKEAQARATHRRGAPLVRRLIEADDAHARSEFERRYTRFSRAHSLPGPDHRNFRVAGHLADCVYAREKLVVELDGRAYHQRRKEMRADRHRDTDYQLAGYRIQRLVWDDLHPDSGPKTATRVRKMLALGNRAA